jgi:hypothetical protein
MQYILLFHCKNGFVNAPQRYVVRTLRVLLSVAWLKITPIYKLFNLHKYIICKFPSHLLTGLELVNVLMISCLKTAENKPLSVTNYTSLLFCIYVQWSEQWCSLLRHCATRWEVPLSISGAVLWNAKWPNPSVRSKSLALRSTQPLTEMSTRNSLGG